MREMEASAAVTARVALHASSDILKAVWTVTSTVLTSIGSFPLSSWKPSFEHEFINIHATIATKKNLCFIILISGLSYSIQNVLVHTTRLPHTTQ